MSAESTLDVTDPEHPVLWVEAGLLRLGITPTLGGRLLSLSHDGRELLWRNPALLDQRLHPVPGHRPGPVEGPMSDWNNYGGSKTWPAPQGWSSVHEWAGPPDPVLDSGPYDHAVVEDDSGVEVTLTSAADPRTGLRLTRVLRVPHAGDRVDVHLRGENTSTAPVRWGLWDVVQLAGGGVADVAHASDVDPVALVQGTGTPRWDRLGETVRVGPQDVVGKLGFPGATGAMTYELDGVTVGWDFEVQADGAYPDEGSRAEIWMEHPLDEPLEHLGGLAPPARIVECEVLGPLRDLAPGETMTLDVTLTVQDVEVGR